MRIGNDGRNFTSVSTFWADEVQAWGLKRTAELLSGKAPRIHWYSLYDLPRDWPTAYLPPIDWKRRLHGGDGRECW